MKNARAKRAKLRPLSEAGKLSFPQYRGTTMWDSRAIQTRNQATLTSFKASLPV